ncbi:MAG: AIPR family protein [Betaproteobacteria bacterium]|nr:AIPR family protein [Betaproteobacteria bacterium]
MPLISRYANSQNKVSDADFFANHPFHRRLEEISRQLWAPPAHGNSFQTKWFYERARGQYLNEQASLSASKKKTYHVPHPKSKSLRRLILAKCFNSWARLPDVVSLGAQRNFVRFAEAIAPQWDASDEHFNERWFKQAVGKAILFRATEQIVSARGWYQGGYRANIIAYTVALLSYLVESVHRRYFDFDQLWRHRGVLPKSLEPQIAELAKHVFRLVAPPSEFANVTEWCKKEGCWKRVREAPPTLGREITQYLSTAEKEIAEKVDAKKAQRLDTQLGRLIYVMQERGQEYWLRALEWNAPRDILPEKEKSILSQVAKKRGFVPSDLQANVLIDAEKKLQDEGFR